MSNFDFPNLLYYAHRLYKPSHCIHIAYIGDFQNAHYLEKFVNLHSKMEFLNCITQFQIFKLRVHTHTHNTHTQHTHTHEHTHINTNTQVLGACTPRHKLQVITCLKLISQLTIQSTLTLLILSKQALIIVGEATSVRDTTYDDTNYMYMHDQKQK